MLSFKRVLARATVICALFGALATASAEPVTYLLTQGSWTQGGEVTGSFTGEDLNGDGFIDLSFGEVFDYQVTFSGNPVIPAFTHTFSELLFFRYTVGSTGFRPSFPLYSLGSGYFYDADDYLVGLPDLSRASFSFEDARVTLVAEVDEPGSIGLLVLALLALALVRSGLLSRHFGPGRLATVAQ
jgi:hypothetical protein